MCVRTRHHRGILSSPGGPVSDNSHRGSPGITKHQQEQGVARHQQWRLILGFASITTTTGQARAGSSRHRAAQFPKQSSPAPEMDLRLLLQEMLPARLAAGPQSINCRQGHGDKFSSRLKLGCMVGGQSGIMWVASGWWIV
ncbi:hypothetical protein Hamer_G028724 [Homarus americanus]|uniref:Uncharacterized protein n=1 Tax=Homarus americanus TaxID=6706 RepID=A0A8J5JJ59_HOMAM|nr:hypothetical protein Hamer_G028724 [Homarus americanus]